MSAGVSLLARGARQVAHPNAIRIAAKTAMQVHTVSCHKSRMCAACGPAARIASCEPAPSAGSCAAAAKGRAAQSKGQIEVAGRRLISAAPTRFAPPVADDSLWVVEDRLAARCGRSFGVAAKDAG